MKIGSIVYATEQGLGRLAKSFFDAGIVTDVVAMKHKHFTNNMTEWYGSKAVPCCMGKLEQSAEARRLCKEMDVMLFFETPFEWNLLNRCRENGVKTVLMTMYEWTPKTLPAQPDLLITPSALDKQYYPQSIEVKVPVVNVPWRQRTKARIFVHNSGNGSVKGRNGTAELIAAFKYVQSPVKLILRSQRKLGWDVTDPRIEVRIGTENYEDLFKEGDVFIFPEKFNGLSLPLQEARASGMLVMATDRFPMNTWLPREPLIPTKGEVSEAVSSNYNTFNMALLDPVDIAKKIDEWWYRDIEEYSLDGKKWALSMSWHVHKPKYMEIFENLLRS